MVDGARFPRLAFAGRPLAGALVLVWALCAAGCFRAEPFIAEPDDVSGDIDVPDSVSDVPDAPDGALPDVSSPPGALQALVFVADSTGLSLETRRGVIERDGQRWTGLTWTGASASELSGSPEPESGGRFTVSIDGAGWEGRSAHGLTVLAPTDGVGLLLAWTPTIEASLAGQWRGAIFRESAADWSPPFEGYSVAMTIDDDGCVTEVTLTSEQVGAVELVTSVPSCLTQNGEEVAIALRETGPFAEVTRTWRGQLALDGALGVFVADGDDTSVMLLGRAGTGATEADFDGNFRGHYIAWSDWKFGEVKPMFQVVGTFLPDGAGQVDGLQAFWQEEPGIPSSGLSFDNLRGAYDVASLGRIDYDLLGDETGGNLATVRLSGQLLRTSNAGAVGFVGWSSGPPTEAHTHARHPSLVVFLKSP